MFVYPLTLYIMQLLKGMLQTNIYITILMTVIGITMIETLLYFIYTFIGTIDTTWSYFAIYRLLPTVLANLIRSEEHTSELQSRFDLVCRLLLEKKNS